MKELIEIRVEDEIVKRLIEGKKLNEFYIKRLISVDSYNSIKRKVLKEEKGRKVYPTEEALVNKIVDEVIQTNNAECIYTFALKGELYVDKLSDAILKTGNLSYIQSFTTYIKNLPIGKFFDKIIESENPFYIANVISNIVANNDEEEISEERTKLIEKLVDRIIEFNANQALFTLLDDESAKKLPINKIVEAVIKSGNEEDISELSDLYSLHLEKNDLEKIADALIYLKKEEDAYEFAVEHPNIRTNELAQIVIDSDNPKYIFKFARDVKDAPIKELTEAIIKSKSSNYICLFARFINNNIEDINRLADRVIELGHIEYILKFASTVKGAPVEKMADIIIQSGSVYHIKLFAQEVENAPIDKMADIIIALGNPEDIYYFAYVVKNAPVDKMFEAINKIVEKE